MTCTKNKAASRPFNRKRIASRLSLVALAAVSIAACRPDHAGPQVAGWTLTDPAERHPILVSKQPVSMTLPVRRGSYGLTNAARSRVARFLNRFGATDTGNSQLIISSPSGSREVAGMHMVAEIRKLIVRAGFPAHAVHVEANHGAKRMRISYLRVVAKGPECGSWPTNLASEPGNTAYPDFGCATQRNFAEMVANPADLLGPRTRTRRTGDRRQAHFERYAAGESSGAAKSADEKIDIAN